MICVIISAANQDDIDSSSSALYQAVSELPQANRDTLAFLVKHLQRFVKPKRKTWIFYDFILA
jgi:hypothetical protein